MNGAHLHLLINHIPVLGVPFGVGLLAVALWRVNLTLQRTGLVVFVLAAVATELALLTGDPAKHVLRQVMAAADYPKAAIQRHDNAATTALICTCILAVLALGALWRARRGPLSRSIIAAFVILGLADTAVLSWVADLGGQIRHTEIRSSNAPNDTLPIQPAS
ncbi:MAG TPA: hypothetical protein VGM77_01955 [Gemmatimonadales bacterium]|jgi:uncharacterized membrane protein